VTAATVAGDTLAGLLTEAWPAKFAGPDGVAAAGAEFGRPLDDKFVDQSHALVIAPGVLRLAGTDIEQSFWNNRRAIEPRHCQVNRRKRGVITAWTRKSRSKMTLTLASLDWSYLSDGAGLPAMLTLTYPASWLVVAPDGDAVKRHLKAFRKRFERAWGQPLRAAWKLEFQRRGAPHVHIGPVAVPMGTAGQPHGRRAAGDGLGFNQWLTAAWADIVDHPDPVERMRHELAGTNVSVAEGMRCTDPKRLGIYFAKHGTWNTKEYQNEVPAEWRETGKTPGRFWGYWGVRPCRAAVPLRKREHLAVSRTLRKLSERSHVYDSVNHRVTVVKAMREVTVKRRHVDPVTGSITVQLRKVRRPVHRLKGHRGFVCVNDAPQLAAALARLVGEP